MLTFLAMAMAVLGLGDRSRRLRAWGCLGRLGFRAPEFSIRGFGRSRLLLVFLHVRRVQGVGFGMSTLVPLVMVLVALTELLRNP